MEYESQTIIFDEYNAFIRMRKLMHNWLALASALANFWYIFFTFFRISEKYCWSKYDLPSDCKHTHIIYYI